MRVLHAAVQPDQDRRVRQRRDRRPPLLAERPDPHDLRPDHAGPAALGEIGGAEPARAHLQRDLVPRHLLPQRADDTFGEEVEAVARADQGHAGSVPRMRDRETLFAIQWAGLVAQVEMFGVYAPQSTLIEEQEMVGSAVPSVDSSLINVALSRDPHEPPHELEAIRTLLRRGRRRQVGRVGPGRGRAGAAAAARRRGCTSTARPRRWWRTCDAIEAEPAEPVDLATVGAINDAAYGLPTPKLGPPIAGAARHRPHLRRPGARRRGRRRRHGLRPGPRGHGRVVRRRRGRRRRARAWAAR